MPHHKCTKVQGTRLITQISPVSCTVLLTCVVHVTQAHQDQSQRPCASDELDQDCIALSVTCLGFGVRKALLTLNTGKRLHYMI